MRGLTPYETGVLSLILFGFVVIAGTITELVERHYGINKKPVDEENEDYV